MSRVNDNNGEDDDKDDDCECNPCCLSPEEQKMQVEEEIKQICHCRCHLPPGDKSVYIPLDAEPDECCENCSAKDVGCCILGTVAVVALAGLVIGAIAASAGGGNDGCNNSNHHHHHHHHCNGSDCGSGPIFCCYDYSSPKPARRPRTLRPVECAHCRQVDTATAVHLDLPRLDDNDTNVMPSAPPFPPIPSCPPPPYTPPDSDPTYETMK